MPVLRMIVAVFFKGIRPRDIALGARGSFISCGWHFLVVCDSIAQETIASWREVALEDVVHGTIASWERGESSGWLLCFASCCFWMLLLPYWDRALAATVSCRWLVAMECFGCFRTVKQCPLSDCKLWDGRFGLRWGRYMFVELATHLVWPRQQHCATTEICCMLCTMGVCQWRLGTFLKAFDLSVIKDTKLMYRDYTDAEGDVCCHLHGFAVFCNACPLVHVWRSPFRWPVSPLLASIPLL